MIISKHKIVSLTYELRVNDKNGDIFEKVEQENPLKFLFGAGKMLPKFEDNLVGKKSGDNFEFMLEAQDAYGLSYDEAIVDIPLSAFEVNGVLKEEFLQIGKVIPMVDADGNRLNGMVLEVNEDAVKVDFNHPLAGDDLYFQGTIINVRDASEQEMEHNHECTHCGKH